MCVLDQAGWSFQRALRQVQTLDEFALSGGTLNRNMESELLGLGDNIVSGVRYKSSEYLLSATTRSLSSSINFSSFRYIDTSGCEPQGYGLCAQTISPVSKEIPTSYLKPAAFSL